jgi:isoleucyl-tRNA synthetase
MKKYYPEVSSNPDFPKLEEKILKFWQEKSAFEASVSNRPPKKNGKDNEFVFYDGPPFANGLPHYGHLLTGFVKDIFARYQTIKGKRVERRFGWDCHGLPAEMGAEKELGISGRHKIVEFGIDKFNDQCRSSVMKFSSDWEKYVNRQARWVDFENDYKTMDKGYMESVLWAFKQLYDKGLVYESMRVMPYSWACETPLSNFETRMDNSYRERTDKAVTVAFTLKDKPKNAPEADEYKILAWTTTPWTLPSNLALAVGKDIEYACVVVEKENSLSLTGERVRVRGEINDHIISNNNHLTEHSTENNFDTFNNTPHPNPLPDEGEGTLKSKRVCYILAESAITKYQGVLTENCVAYRTISRVGQPKMVQMSAEGNFSDEIQDVSNSLLAQISVDGFTGKNLVGLSYKPLFPYFADTKDAFKIVAGDFVTEGDGTGIVHLAPGFGEDDFEVCKKENIAGLANPKTPVICPVDNSGKYTTAIYDLNPLSLFGERVRVRGERSELLIQNARELRKNSTDVEKELWSQLRGRRFDGYKFRRQHDIDKYIVDFVCLSKMLVIELDGGQHAENSNIEYDNERTDYLESKGYRVLRFWNNELNDNFEGVLEVIYNALNNTPHPNPLPKEGEGILSLKGRNVLECNDDIIKYLKTQGSWIKTEQYIHNYPHCWRTDTPLIYKAVPSWYVEVTKFKDRMVELNQQINWIPSHIKDGQFGKWLENARDWSISRNRFWGAPIPIWRSDNPDNEKLYVFGSIKELEEFFEVKVEDLHRPFIDTLTKPDPENPEYTLRRVEDVFDCWFESGSMPYAQAHYPFENKDWFESHFPADFIVEYAAQTRGWFYTLMVLSTALFDRPPFLNVICHGVVLDEKGQKLSKRLNNYADPMEVFDKFGSDAMRWVMISAPIMHGGELLIDKEGNMVRDAVRLVMKPIWNSYSFFALYANADGVQARFKSSSDNLMDRYILAKCKNAVYNIEKAMDSYDTPLATKAVEEFFEVLNNWYIRRNKERFWRSHKDADKFEAYNTLYSVLNIMCRAVSPLLPLLAEEIWQGIEGQGGASVHLADFPDVSEILDEANLMQDMDRVRDVCNTTLSIRGAENVRVRQPLASLTVVDSEPKRLEDYADLIKDEVNVKEVKFSSNIAEFADLRLKVNFPVLGKRLPAKMKDVIAATKKGEWKKLEGGRIEAVGEVLTEEECSLELVPKAKGAAQALSTNDALVVLDLNVTNELKIEGVARDLVRLVQQSRKDADLNITDRISLNIQTDSNVIAAALDGFGNYIAEQTLADYVGSGKSENSNHRFEQKIDGSDVVIWLSKVA